MNNNPKYIYIPFKEWKQLVNEIQLNKDENNSQIISLVPAFKYKETTDSANNSNEDIFPTITKIKNMIERTNFIFRGEKSIPIELRRAMFLSNVFTEKANQLELRRILRQVYEQKENMEKDRIRVHERDYQIKMREKDATSAKKKKLLGQHLQEELRKIKMAKENLHEKELKNEKDELLQIAEEIHKSQEEVLKQSIQKKQDSMRLFSNDLREKQEYRKRHSNEGRYENKCILSPKASKICMKQDFAKVPTEFPAGKKTPKVSCIISLPISKKSYVEVNREMYEKKLNEERIQMHKNQIRQLANLKDRENFLKKIDYEQRLQNLNVTDALMEKNHRKRFETINENRNVWSKQCAEKKYTFNKERLEDKERAEKLRRDMKKEEEDLLNDMRSILQEFNKQGKNTFPIIKCLKEFEKNKLSKSKKLPQQLRTSLVKLETSKDEQNRF